MRKIKDTQGWIDFQAPSNLAFTDAYAARYQAVSDILDRTPAILELVHKDLETTLRSQTSTTAR